MRGLTDEEARLLTEFLEPPSLDPLEPELSPEECIIADTLTARGCAKEDEISWVTADPADPDFEVHWVGTFYSVTSLGKLALSCHVATRSMKIF